MSLFLLVNTILALNIILIKSTLLGAVFLVLYLAANGYLAGKIVKKLLNIQDSIINWFLGVFLTFSLVSFAGGAMIVLYKFNDLILSIIVLAISLIIFLAHRFYYNSTAIKLYSYKALKFYSFIALQKINLQSWLTLIYIIMFLLFFIGFYTVFSSAAPKEHIITPWQALPAQFAWVIVLLSALILGFVFFRPSRYLLLFIILFSFLQHFYIPAVYRLPYGLDDWRHIGSMEKIAADEIIEPLGVKNAITSSKLSYSSFWAGALFLNKALNVNLAQITIWWQAIFFSLFLPILMYVLVDMLEKHFKSCKDLKCFLPFLAAFLPSFFYPFQLYGAIFLPVGFNFLFFLFFLITVITWLNGQNHKLRYIIAVEFILMFFGYVIYWLMAGLVIGVLIVRHLTQNYHQSVKKKLIRIAYLFLSIIFIPIISLWTSPNARFDVLTTQMDYFGDFWKHNIQYFFGFKKIGSPRPQAGNLIWHDLRQNFVDAVPFNWQYFDTVLLMILIVLLILGLRQLSKRAEKSSVASLILYLFTVTLVSIFLDHYYFGGIHLLTERMDLLVDLFLILILVFSITSISISNFKFLISNQIPNPKSQLPNTVFLIILFSLIICSTYISGPVYGRATEPHYQAAQRIWQDMEEHGRQNYCVLSEHFPLAALEAASYGKVVNGNFPIEYGYLEQGGKLFVKMFSSPNIKWMKQAMLEAADAPGCYFILDREFTADWNLTQIRWILGREILQVDDVRVWRYDEN